MGRGGATLEVESSGPMVHDDNIAELAAPPVKPRKNEIVPKFGRFTQAISNWTSPRQQHSPVGASPATRGDKKELWSEDDEAKEMAERRKDAETVAARLEDHLSSARGKGGSSTPLATSTGTGTPASKHSPTQPTQAGQGGASKASSAKSLSPGVDQPGFIARMLGWGGDAAQSKSWPGDGHPPSAHKVEMLVGEWTVSATITGATTQSPASSIIYRPYVAYAILVELSLGEERGKATYVVSRRFSRFMELHSQLKKDYPPENLPKHPPKEPFCSSVDPAGDFDCASLAQLPVQTNTHINTE